MLLEDLGNEVESNEPTLKTVSLQKLEQTVYVLPVGQCFRSRAVDGFVVTVA
jgi:hypothetical protein